MNSNYCIDTEAMASVTIRVLISIQGVCSLLDGTRWRKGTGSEK